MIKWKEEKLLFEEDKIMASENSISSIFKDLTNVHENLLSLSDDIWNSIDHNDSQKLEEGYQFKKKFNYLLENFEKNKNDICILVSQFTGIKLNEQQKEIKKEDLENHRIIKELNKNEPHEITEDFTFKRPTAFIFNGRAYTDLNNWTDFFIQFIECVAKTNHARLKEMAEIPSYISKQNKKYYSTIKNDLRKPKKIMNGFYVETNLSANEFAKRIIEILTQLKMRPSDITIYLRQDRNA